MHILFLTDNFPPEVNAPASRTFEHAREWVKAGHRVTVMTGAPNFPAGVLYEGYRNRVWQKETIDGVDVIRVWTYITANEGFLRRSLDYASFMVSATLAAPFAAKPDVVVATSPQIFTTLAGYFVSRIKRIPFVFELRDLWPESIRAVGAMKSDRLLNWLEALELFLYRKSDLIITVTHAFRKNLVDRGIPKAKIHIVTNGADLTRFVPQARDEALAGALGVSNKFVAGYIGTHGLAHSLETILTAAEHLQEIGQDDVQLLLLGNGASKAALQRRAAEMRLTNVTFLESVPKENVPKYWSLLDASITHLRNTELFTTVIPSKLFEGMAMGIPVLHGVRGESAELVKKADVGLVFEPENASELCDNLIKLKDDPELRRRLQSNARSSAGHYDRTHLANQMLEKIKSLTLAGDR